MEQWESSAVRGGCCHPQAAAAPQLPHPERVAGPSVHLSGSRDTRAPGLCLKFAFTIPPLLITDMDRPQVQLCLKAQTRVLWESSHPPSDPDCTLWSVASYRRLTLPKFSTFFIRHSPCITLPHKYLIPCQFLTARKLSIYFLKPFFDLQMYFNHILQWWEFINLEDTKDCQLR